jgi:hypothetical protein
MEGQPISKLKRIKVDEVENAIVQSFHIFNLLHKCSERLQGLVGCMCNSIGFWKVTLSLILVAWP